MNLSQDQKNLLSTTPPTKDNPNIAFPEHYKQGRIVIDIGRRILDWEGTEWVAYEKDSAQWFPEPLTDDDFEVLSRVFNKALS